MKTKNDSFIEDLLLPTLVYRLDHLIPDVEKTNNYAEAKKRLLIRKVEHQWWYSTTHIAMGCSSYVLSWQTSTIADVCRWSNLSIGSDNAVSESCICFHLRNGKSGDAFAYEFSSKQNEMRICRYVDLNLPEWADQQIRDAIESRLSTEYISCCCNFILRPVETCEEVLIRKDMGIGSSF